MRVIRLQSWCNSVIDKLVVNSALVPPLQLGANFVAPDTKGSYRRLDLFRVSQDADAVARVLNIVNGLTFRTRLKHRTGKWRASRRVVGISTANHLMWMEWGAAYCTASLRNASFVVATDNTALSDPSSLGDPLLVLNVTRALPTDHPSHSSPLVPSALARDAHRLLRSSSDVMVPSYIDIEYPSGGSPSTAAASVTVGAVAAAVAASPAALAVLRLIQTLHVSASTDRHPDVPARSPRASNAAPLLPLPPHPSPTIARVHAAFTVAASVAVLAAEAAAAAPHRCRVDASTWDAGSGASAALSVQVRGGQPARRATDVFTPRRSPRRWVACRAFARRMRQLGVRWGIGGGAVSRQVSPGAAWGGHVAARAIPVLRAPRAPVAAVAKPAVTHLGITDWAVRARLGPRHGSATAGSAPGGALSWTDASAATAAAATPLPRGHRVCDGVPLSHAGTAALGALAAAAHVGALFEIAGARRDSPPPVVQQGDADAPCAHHAASVAVLAHHHDSATTTAANARMRTQLAVTAHRAALALRRIVLWGRAVVPLRVMTATVAWLRACSVTDGDVAMTAVVSACWAVRLMDCSGRAAAHVLRDAAAIAAYGALCVRAGVTKGGRIDPSFFGGSGGGPTGPVSGTDAPLARRQPSVAAQAAPTAVSGKPSTAPPSWAAALRGAIQGTGEPAPAASSAAGDAPAELFPSKEHPHTTTSAAGTTSAPLPHALAHAPHPPATTTGATNGDARVSATAPAAPLPCALALALVALHCALADSLANTRASRLAARRRPIAGGATGEGEGAARGSAGRGSLTALMVADASVAQTSVAAECVCSLVAPRASAAQFTHVPPPPVNAVDGSVWARTLLAAATTAAAVTPAAALLSRRAMEAATAFPQGPLEAIGHAVSTAQAGPALSLLAGHQAASLAVQRVPTLLSPQQIARVLWWVAHTPAHDRVGVVGALMSAAVTAGAIGAGPRAAAAAPPSAPPSPRSASPPTWRPCPSTPEAAVCAAAIAAVLSASVPMAALPADVAVAPAHPTLLPRTCTTAPSRTRRPPRAQLEAESPAPWACGPIGRGVMHHGGGGRAWFAVAVQVCAAYCHAHTSRSAPVADNVDNVVLRAAAAAAWCGAAAVALGVSAAAPRQAADHPALAHRFGRCDWPSSSAEAAVGCATRAAVAYLAAPCGGERVCASDPGAPTALVEAVAAVVARRPTHAPVVSMPASPPLAAAAVIHGALLTLFAPEVVGGPRAADIVPSADGTPGDARWVPFWRLEDGLRGAQRPQGAAAAAEADADTAAERAAPPRYDASASRLLLADVAAATAVMATIASASVRTAAAPTAAPADHSAPATVAGGCPDALRVATAAVTVAVRVAAAVSVPHSALRREFTPRHANAADTTVADAMTAPSVPLALARPPQRPRVGAFVPLRRPADSAAMCEAPVGNAVAPPPHSATTLGGPLDRVQTPRRGSRVRRIRFCVTPPATRHLARQALLTSLAACAVASGSTLGGGDAAVATPAHAGRGAQLPIPATVSRIMLSALTASGGRRGGRTVGATMSIRRASRVADGPTCGLRAALPSSPSRPPRRGPLRRRARASAGRAVSPHASPRAQGGARVPTVPLPWSPPVVYSYAGRTVERSSGRAAARHARRAPGWTTWRRDAAAIVVPAAATGVYVSAASDMSAAARSAHVRPVGIAVARTTIRHRVRRVVSPHDAPTWVSTCVHSYATVVRASRDMGDDTRQRTPPLPGLAVSGARGAAAVAPPVVLSRVRACAAPRGRRTACAMRLTRIHGATALPPRSVTTSAIFAPACGGGDGRAAAQLPSHAAGEHAETGWSPIGVPMAALLASDAPTGSAIVPLVHTPGHIAPALAARPLWLCAARLIPTAYSSSAVTARRALMPLLSPGAAPPASRHGTTSGPWRKAHRDPASAAAAAVGAVARAICADARLLRTEPRTHSRCDSSDRRTRAALRTALRTAPRVPTETLSDVLRAATQLVGGWSDAQRATDALAKAVGRVAGRPIGALVPHQADVATGAPRAGRAAQLASPSGALSSASGYLGAGRGWDGGGGAHAHALDIDFDFDASGAGGGEVLDSARCALPARLDADAWSAHGAALSLESEVEGPAVLVATADGTCGVAADPTPPTDGEAFCIEAPHRGAGGTAPPSLRPQAASSVATRGAGAVLPAAESPLALHSIVAARAAAAAAAAAAAGPALLAPAAALLLTAAASVGALVRAPRRRDREGDSLLAQSLAGPSAPLAAASAQVARAGAALGLVPGAPRRPRAPRRRDRRGFSTLAPRRSRRGLQARPRRSVRARAAWTARLCIRVCAMSIAVLRRASATSAQARPSPLAASLDS